MLGAPGGVLKHTLRVRDLTSVPRCLTVSDMRWVLIWAMLAVGAKGADRLEGGVADAGRGTIRSSIRSVHQKGETLVEVLLPAGFDAAKAHRVLYVLPVVAGEEAKSRWGDGLMELKKTGLADKHQLIAVTMTFDTLPWYVDHPTDKQIAQEKYLREVIGRVEATYKTSGDKESRLLVGFSKSGWGAVSLLLRDPEFFGYAAAWDAPLALVEEDWQSFGIAQAAGTVENFSKFSPVNLAKSAGESLKKQKRLLITGEANFGSDPRKKYGPDGHTKRYHALLEKEGVLHVFDDTLKTPHAWSGVWLGPAVERLVELVVEANQRTGEGANRR